MSTPQSVIDAIQAALTLAQGLLPSPTQSVILQLELTDPAAVAAAAGQADVNQAVNIAQPWAFNPEFGIESTGLKYLRFSTDPNLANPSRERLLDWRLPLPGGYDKGWTRVVLYIEPDVKTGMNPAEIGMKLPGPTNEFSAGQTELMSLRTGHKKSDPANPGTYQFWSYYYDQEPDPSGYGKIELFNATLFEGRYHCLEVFHQLNTPSLADGILEVWVDDVMAFRRTDVRYRSSPQTQLRWIYVNVYHGGQTNPGMMHYRLAKLAFSDQRLGVPAEVPRVIPPVNTGPFPAWRNNKPKDKWFTIPMTSNMGGKTLNTATVNAWNGFGAGDGLWVAAADGGHQDSSEDKVISIDFKVDAPMWALQHAGSVNSIPTDKTRYADGLPASRHTYYQAHVIRARNRVMLFGGSAVNVASLTTAELEGFDLTAKQWDAVGTHPNAPFSYAVMGCAKHSITEDVYIGGLNKFAKWTQATDKWSVLALPNQGGAGGWEYKPSFIDVMRNEWVLLNGIIRKIDLTTLAWSDHPITGALTGNTFDYSMIVHDLDNDRYVTIQGGNAQGGAVNANVYAINPITFVSTLLGTVPAAYNGVNNRMAYFQSLGGIAYLPRFESNILFMPTR